MKTTRVVVVLVMASAFACADGGNFKDALRRQYEKHLLVLRTAFQKGNQDFDSSGRPLKDPPANEWRVYGPILVQKLDVDSKRYGLRDRA